MNERDQAILEFERAWEQGGATAPAGSGHGTKEDAIRDTFGVSPARYYQLLGALLTSPEALAHDPMLVGRLTRLRDARRAARRARISPDS